VSTVPQAITGHPHTTISPFFAPQERRSPLGKPWGLSPWAITSFSPPGTFRSGSAQPLSPRPGEFLCVLLHARDKVLVTLQTSSLAPSCAASCARQQIAEGHVFFPARAGILFLLGQNRSWSGAPRDAWQALSPASSQAPSRSPQQPPT
jgi:hypothetical protein